MSKKAKQSKQKKKVTTNPSQADKWLGLIEEQIFRENYTEAATNCERLLNYLAQHAPQRALVLAHLGAVQSMLQNYPQSYEAFTEALALEPNDAELWYNRSGTSQFTGRHGQALRDIERAIQLNTVAELAGRFDKALKFNRKIAEEAMKLRGPNFTLDQLIEQEEHFQQGLKSMEAANWAEAGQAFEASIALGDCLPQPWGNLGISLMMQKRYDEAEEAFKHALIIDPKYAIAKNNLAALPETRKVGPPEMIGMHDPYKSSNVKHSLTLLEK
jgi:tetratricopeptide (TPR) repeat protein